MVLTVNDCAGHIKHRLGTTDDGGGLSHELSVLDVVNASGMWLTNAHQWKWMQQRSASLDLVADSSLVALPADFGSAIDIETNNESSGFEWATLPRILDLEKSSGTSIFFEGAIEYDHSSSPPVPVLRIWPTPTASETGSLKLYYRSQWVDLTEDSDTIDLPAFMHPLYIEIVREYAAGWEEQDVADTTARLERIMAGPQWRAARKIDAQVQPNYGVLRNGIASRAGTGDDYRRYFADGGIA